MTDTAVSRRGLRSAFIPRRLYRGERTCTTNTEAPMPLKVSAFIGSTFLLTAEQKTAYLSLLMATWLDKKPLTDDNALLARVCGVTTHRFAVKIRPEIEHFFASEDGCWWPCAGHIDDPSQRRLPEQEWAALRAKILKRDNYTCSYCGQKSPHVEVECDHIIPISRGGSNEPGNLTAACFECNRAKSDKLLEEWTGDAS